MKYFFSLLLLGVLGGMFSTEVYSFDYSFKVDPSFTTTDNVNSEKTNKDSDRISTINTYAEANDGTNRFRIKLKASRYKTFDENDSNYLEANYRYRHQKNQDYVFAVFAERYPNVQTIDLDTSSNNNGFFVQGNFSNQMNQKVLGYFNTQFTYKNYYDQLDRTDYTPEAFLGLEFSPNSFLQVIPEFNAAINSSKEDYYDSKKYGLSIMLLLLPTDSLEFSLSYNFQKTLYGDRPFTLIRNGRSTLEDEEEDQKTLDFGATVYVSDIMFVSGKYSIIEVTSNNTSNDYETKNFKMSLGFRF